MKYERVTKVKRNQQLWEYVQQHPELSLTEIGEIFRISRQRVAQLLKRKQLNG